MIKVDINKAKDIVHAQRRVARDEQMAPLDIKVTIPMYAADAEAQRQEIREKFESLQTQIDSAETADELKALLDECAK